jgi:hypothetical protein
VSFPSASYVCHRAILVTLNADVKFRICMTPEDLGKAGLGESGKKLAKRKPSCDS